MVFELLARVGDVWTTEPRTLVSAVTGPGAETARRETPASARRGRPVWALSVSVLWAGRASTATRTSGRTG